MHGAQSHEIGRIRQSLSLVKLIVTISVGVVLPVLLSTAVGIVAGESSLTLILGILVVSFTAVAIGGATILYVLLGRRARLERLQSDPTRAEGCLRTMGHTARFRHSGALLVIMTRLNLDFVLRQRDKTRENQTITTTVRTRGDHVLLKAGKEIPVGDMLGRITVNPKIFGGKPIIRGRGFAVEHVLEMLAASDHRGLSMARAGRCPRLPGIRSSSRRA